MRAAPAAEWEVLQMRPWTRLAAAALPLLLGDDESRSGSAHTPRLVGMYDSGFSHAQCPDNSTAPACGPSRWYGGSDPQLAGWTNLAMSDAADAVFASTQPHRPKYQLLQLSDTLWNSSALPLGVMTLRDDWRESWAALLPTARALHANGTIHGFFFGDELVGGAG